MDTHPDISIFENALCYTLERLKESGGERRITASSRERMQAVYAMVNEVIAALRSRSRRSQPAVPSSIAAHSL